MPKSTAVWRRILPNIRRTSSKRRFRSLDTSRRTPCERERPERVRADARPSRTLTGRKLEGDALPRAASGERPRRDPSGLDNTPAVAEGREGNWRPGGGAREGAIATGVHTEALTLLE